ncbi:MAG: hypothetical protein R3D33_00450 [Hyphomicrobiaceae bacterium]
MDDLAMIGGTFEVSMSPWFKAGVGDRINGSKVDRYGRLRPKLVDDPADGHWSSQNRDQNAHLLDLYTSLALSRALVRPARRRRLLPTSSTGMSAAALHLFLRSRSTDGVKDLRDVVGDF